MRFDPQQGRRLEAFFALVSAEAIRILKPGGFMVAFSQGRLVHRLAVAAEDAGFEIRDQLIWEHQGGQGKAFTQAHFVQRMPITLKQRKAIIAKLDGRKTPQLRPKFEPMILGQKPRTGTFVANWLERQTGLVKLEFDNAQQTTVFSYRKPNKSKAFEHMTVKPADMIRRLIEIFTLPGQTVLDPFMGSGTTAVAALDAGRRVIGFEIERKYYLNTLKRIQPYEEAR